MKKWIYHNSHRTSPGAGYETWCVIPLHTCDWSLPTESEAQEGQIQFKPILHWIYDDSPKPMASTAAGGVQFVKVCWALAGAFFDELDLGASMHSGIWAKLSEDDQLTRGQTRNIGWTKRSVLSNLKVVPWFPSHRAAPWLGRQARRRLHLPGAECILGNIFEFISGVCTTWIVEKAGPSWSYSTQWSEFRITLV